VQLKLSKIAILGPGLIGGSLLLALRVHHLASQISLYSPSREALDEIAATELPCSLHTCPAEAVTGANLVILCVPVRAMKEVLSAALPGLLPEAVVTDVGSVKEVVERELAPLLRDRAHWIGSHPMAGRELSGFSAAQADLFHGATCILTPTESTTARAHNLAHEFWHALGMKLVRLSPAEHDLLVAEISHLPHLVAAALTLIASSASLPLAGPSFRDTTRIASGPAEMWRDILLDNHEAVSTHLTALISLLQTTQDALTRQDGPLLERLFQGANAVRQKITK
jgi:prephenate dehydrogenase